jgi:hypothetical protein
MAVDSRDQIWAASFETYYDAHYEELVADSLIGRWQIVDEITKVLVALTASGSAVSGWTLWNNPSFKYVWMSMAGVGAVLSIIHVALAVPGRLKDWGEIKRSFASLRIDLETYRYRMGIDPQFPVEDFTKEFSDYRRRFGECVQRIKNDILRTRRLRVKAQDALNERIADKIVTD